MHLTESPEPFVKNNIIGVYLFPDDIVVPLVNHNRHTFYWPSSQVFVIGYISFGLRCDFSVGNKESLLAILSDAGGVQRVKVITIVFGKIINSMFALN